MIEKLDRTLSTADIIQKPTPTNNRSKNKQSINNNRTTALEQTAAETTLV